MQVGSVNFSSTFDPNAESPAKCTKFYTNMVSIDCRADVLCSDVEDRVKVSRTIMAIIHL